MNYYEELGVSPAARAEEIRHAYKTLARLLHPDQIPNPDQKRLAELQMRRLNGIFATLSHPEHRLRYNRQLQTQPAEASRRVPERIVIHAPVERRWLRPIALALYAWGALAALILAGTAAVTYSGGSLQEVVPAISAWSRPQSAPDAGAEQLFARLQASQRELEALRAANEKMLEQLASQAHPLPGEPVLSETPAGRPERHLASRPAGTPTEPE